jgi:uncharacterized protein (TIGR02284 family)
MTFSYPKAKKLNTTSEVLNDLIKINSDRIAGYQMALDNSKEIDEYIKEEFKKIISEGNNYKQQLMDKAGEFRESSSPASSIFGKIYQAWKDLKVSFAGNTQKNIMASCQYNEEIALHAYRAALNANAGMSKEIANLIEDQEAALRKTCEQIRKYREIFHISNYSLMYFN